MQGSVNVHPDDDLSAATRELLANGLREIAVVGHDRQVLGMLDEVRIAEAYVRAVVRDDES
jgi:predicted transcriptional regulator